MNNLVPMTELEAVNLLLMTIGEQQVNTLDDTGIATVSTAKQILKQVGREVQSIGLHCNSEYKYPITLTTDSEVILPTNTLRVVLSYPYDTVSVTLRGSRLYNLDNHTYKFENNPTKVDIIFFLDFEELPQVVRNYIAIRASRIFQTKKLGSETLHQFSLLDEQQARAALLQEETETGNYNILRNPHTQYMLRRY